MAISIWPDTLPNFEFDSITIEQGSVIKRTRMDSGFQKTRRVYTGSKGKFSGEIILDSAQLDTFEDFFEFDLNYGANSFLFSDPVYLGYLIEVRLRADGDSPIYKVDPLSGDDRWVVSFTLEKIKMEN